MIVSSPFVKELNKQIKTFGTEACACPPTSRRRFAPMWTKKKDTERPKGHSALRKIEKLFLNLTPFSPQSPRLWHFVLCCDGVATLAEQSAAAVLMSKLLDTAALDYLRRRTPCVLRRKGGKSFFSAKKRKIPSVQKDTRYLCEGAIKKIFSPFFVWV